MTMINCANHPDKEADHYCGSCGLGFCDECVGSRVFEQTRVCLCPRCGFAVTPIKRYKSVAPFHKNLGAIFSYPWQRKYWWAPFAGVAIANVFLKGIFWGGFWDLPQTVMATNYGFGLTLIYYLFLAFFFFRIFRDSEKGNFDTLELLEGSSVDGYIKPLRELFESLAAAFLPVLIALPLLVLSIQSIRYSEAFGIVHIMGVVLGLAFPVLLIYGFFVLPMVMMIIGVSKNFRAALHPLFIIVQIQKMKREYLLACALFYTIVTAYLAVRVAAWIFLYPEMLALKIFYFAVVGALELYLFMVLGHLLGYVAHQCRFKLKWTESEEKTFEPLVPAGQPAAQTSPPTGADSPEAVLAPPDFEDAGSESEKEETEEEEAAEPGSPEDLQNKLNKAEEKSASRLYNEAAEIFQTVLQHDPENRQALTGLQQIYVKQNEWRMITKNARTLSVVLWKQKEMDELITLYEQTRSFNQDFYPSPEILWDMAAYLENRAEFLEAARKYRELGVVHKTHKLAVPALARCAVLLEEKEEKLDTALKVWEALSARYEIKNVEGVDIEEKIRVIKGKISEDPQRYLG